RSSACSRTPTCAGATARPDGSAFASTSRGRRSPRRPSPPTRTPSASKVFGVLVLVVLFWVSLGALVWTHVGYPLLAALIAGIRPRRVRKGELEPIVTVVVAAHDEEDVIGRRLDNLLALDYPPDRLEIVVASDASTDRTDELVEGVAAREPRVRLLRCPR